MTARRLTLATLLTWPAGLLLVVANMEVDAVTPPVYVALAALYAAECSRCSGPGTPTVTEQQRCWWRCAGTLRVGRVRGATNCRRAGADAPQHCRPVDRRLGAPARRDPDRHRAPGVALPRDGHSGSRAARHGQHPVSRQPRGAWPVVVLSRGRPDEQAAVEDHAWVAFEYLRGLEGSPDFVTYLLVWLDLLQLAYLATTYVAFAAVARLMKGTA